MKRQQVSFEELQSQSPSRDEKVKSLKRHKFLIDSDSEIESEDSKEEEPNEVVITSISLNRPGGVHVRDEKLPNERTGTIAVSK